MADGVNASIDRLIDRLKDDARRLHKQAGAGDPRALARLAPVRKQDEPVQRRHCLAARARELGFTGWPHARAVLSGERFDDFGTLLYPPGASAHWNIWSADYGEARGIREEHGGYLLAYRHQFLIVDHYFIETIGLDPEDPDWARIGRDWVKPGDVDARARLYEKLIEARRSASAA